jgi:hypothetical protein
MAAAANVLPARCEPILPATDAAAGRATVLDEKQTAFRPQYATYFKDSRRLGKNRSVSLKTSRPAGEWRYSTSFSATESTRR